MTHSYKIKPVVKHTLMPHVIHFHHIPHNLQEPERRKSNGLEYKLNWIRVQLCPLIFPCNGKHK